MRTKLTAVILMLFMLITSFCGCNNDTPDVIENTNAETTENNTKEENSVDYNDVYSDFLAEKESTTVAENSRVVAMFSADAEAFDEYAVFTVDESEYSTKILFMAEGTVTDFNFLSLLIKDVDENGNMTFDSQSLYSRDVLTEDKPLEVTLTFYGDTPAYGISYKDAQGITKNYTVTISGEDGAIILSEF